MKKEWDANWPERVAGIQRESPRMKRELARINAPQALGTFYLSPFTFYCAASRRRRSFPVGGEGI
jgi:hypothetical protein